MKLVESFNDGCGEFLGVVFVGDGSVEREWERIR